MKLRIIGHPVRQMRLRSVTQADIEHALANHHMKIESSRANSVTYEGPGMNGDVLKVWTLPPGIVDEDTTIIIKSVAWKNREDPT